MQKTNQKVILVEILTVILVSIIVYFTVSPIVKQLVNEFWGEER